jgi:uncharacterized protein (DUF488 family)
MTNGRKTVIYTLGHSTRSLEEFFALLSQYHVRTLVDIRSLPGSRKFPHFDRENMEKVLPENGVTYVWFKSLGGLRRVRKDFDSPNTGLTNSGFRAYADYMASEEFRSGVQELLKLASDSVTAVMCAEAVYWKCHRRLLSDSLLARGAEVLHILGPKSLQPHGLSVGAIISPDLTVVYPKVEAST